MDEDFVSEPIYDDLEEYWAQLPAQDDPNVSQFPIVPPGFRRHYHQYRNRTDVVRRHDHRMGGNTGFAVNFLGSHVHRYMGVTSYDRGHRHRYAGWTGRAIGPITNHIHRYNGVTSVDADHSHSYRGQTGRPRRPFLGEQPQPGP
ncbi:MAG: hypothetical protein GX755_06945 [Syntrophomonadaceae bacterium]|nr:hypothetical protein [Syntrophomonadaceae bacterium]